MNSKKTQRIVTDSTTAQEFTRRLYQLQSDQELRKIQRYFKSGDKFIGVKMGKLFSLAKEFSAMDPSEIEKLLEDDVHEVRAGAVSIMDKQARNNKTTPERRKELYALYLRRHDRINNWDLVDLGAIHVVGRYLFDKSRKPLHKLAKSKNMWERRSAIVATGYFVFNKQTEETFAIARLLVKDKEDLVQKAVGGWIRHAGKQGKKSLTTFLDRFAASMPRTMLRYAIEHLTKKEKAHYMAHGRD